MRSSVGSFLTGGGRRINQFGFELVDESGNPNNYFLGE